ncbi:MAG: shikimate kinase [Magnetococcales bacterium]|nr:shikimate kinase [Magnetococcales bacterium]
MIGMRGCGKSNISRRLSVLTKRNVLSTDALISYENQGNDISTIITKNSGDWRVFRELEYLIVKKTVALDDLIIDTGGGVVVDIDLNNKEVFSQRKVKLLKQNGLVIWLKGDISLLVKKVGEDINRPKLSSATSDIELMEMRLPFYKDAADIVINIDGKKRKDVAKEIMGVLINYPEFASLDYFQQKANSYTD